MKNLIYLALFLASAVGYADASESFRKTLGELVRADTTNPPGNEARAVEILAARLKEAGVAYEIIEFAPGRQNLVARLKGTGAKKPLMLLAHLDVVGTKDQAWTTEPHTLTEKDGYLYGRGTGDDLGMAVANLETFLAFKKSGVKLQRDLILAFTGDEESGGAGIKYVLQHRPELLDAEIALNEGGNIVMKADGSPHYLKIEVAQKTYQDFDLVTKGTTGHSSVPRPDNAIYRLARALDRLEKNPPKPRLLPLTRAFFKARAAIEPKPLGPALKAAADSRGEIPKAALKILLADPLIAAHLITTCVPTMLAGGTKANALPPEAHVTLNCRILPDETVEQVQNRMAKVIADTQVEVRRDEDNGVSEGSPVEGEVPTAIAKVAREMWPGIPVLPALTLGATDSRYLRPLGVRAYGMHPVPRTDPDLGRAHGVDERIPVSGIGISLEFLRRLVTELAG